MAVEVGADGACLPLSTAHRAAVEPVRAWAGVAGDSTVPLSVGGCGKAFADLMPTWRLVEVGAGAGRRRLRFRVGESRQDPVPSLRPGHALEGRHDADPGAGSYSAWTSSGKARSALETGVRDAELAFWNRYDALTDTGGSPNGFYRTYKWYGDMSGNMLT